MFLLTNFVVLDFFLAALLLVVSFRLLIRAGLLLLFVLTLLIRILFLLLFFILVLVLIISILFCFILLSLLFTILYNLARRYVAGARA